MPRPKPFLAWQHSRPAPLDLRTAIQVGLRAISIWVLSVVAMCLRGLGYFDDPRIRVEQYEQPRHGAGLFLNDFSILLFGWRLLAQRAQTL